VCRQWREAAAAAAAAAAAGRDGIHLLYQAGHEQKDQSFAAWLAGNSQRLEALTITTSSFDPNDPAVFVRGSINNSSANMILGALAEAATAAAAAGRPVPLHTLRVLGAGPDLDITGQLLAALPHLRTLQLNLWGGCSGEMSMAQYDSALQQHLAPLKETTQLQELYVFMPRYQAFDISSVPGLLPGSLRRLGLGAHRPWPPDLSHMTHLSFLQLEGWSSLLGPISSRLPQGLQELRLHNMGISLADLQEQHRDALAGCPGSALEGHNLSWLPKFSNIQSVTTAGIELGHDPSVRAALQQLVKLSALEVYTFSDRLQPMLSAAQRWQGLRCLHLHMGCWEGAPRLAALTQLTRLVISSLNSDSTQQQQQQQQQRALVPELGRMAGLRWLSVPGVLLAADPAWLGGLQQLQVLVLSSEGGRRAIQFEPPRVLPQVVEGLEGCSPQALPPRLLLLGFTGVTAEQEVALHVRRRLQRSLGSSGCEVVVGPDLDEVADPVKQLAGLPVALQQALA
jgi:hypothetical protein